MTQDYKKVIAAINDAGANRTPFLFVINYEKSEGAIITHPLEQEEVLFSIGTTSNINEQKRESRQVTGEEALQLTKEPMGLESYRQRFEVIQKGMRDGSSLLANLTVCTPIATLLTLEEIFYNTRAKYKLLFPERHFVCFSPERFVKITREGVITTDPMKGTITSDTPRAPEAILNNYKETSEHCSVVDLLRSDLSAVAEDVSVSRFRYFTEIETPQHKLYQVSSEIKGQLPADWRSRIGNILDKILPAGSIMGVPRRSSRDLIALAEGKDTRGYYCGIFGYFDGSKLDSSVLIRFIREDDEGHKYYHSGGGITINSHLEEEYREVMDKIYLPVK